MASIDILRQIWADVLGIDISDFSDDDNFMALGGNSIKAIQFLGEIATFVENIDLAAFLNDATIKSVWETIKTYQKNTNLNNSNSITAATERGPGHIISGISFNAVASNLRKAGISEDEITDIAPVSSIQEFFLHHQRNGGTGCMNYFYEVEGPNLKQGLKHFTQLLEAKNPIFRTTVAEVSEEKFALALLSKTASPWSYPPDIQSHLKTTAAQQFQLGAPAARYALVLGDAAHEGRNFFIISVYHTHTDAFTRFLIDKEMSLITQSPSDYARAENTERPWFGSFVKHVHLTTPQEEVVKFWDNYLRGADVANIHPLDKAVVSGTVEPIITDMLPVPFLNSEVNGDAPRNPTQVILAAWAMALAKLSGHRDVTFGLCRHGRSSNTFADVWRVMGPLVNAVPFRISVQRKEEPVEELLHRVESDIATTTEWEQGFAPGVVPSPDGRPWVQSFVNMSSELHNVNTTGTTNESDSAITKMIPRPDLVDFNTDYHWAIILMIKRLRDQYQVSMLCNLSLLSRDKAGGLFNDFKAFMSALSAGDEKIVGDFLE
ncbi:uncharacterized protein TRIVIDRAFT_222800 [Trichoderma virens Gv29-8]|uniref:Carrier domain-containing protein n=1 Tax=Hypocrea virens (strain Gv29-8 / FGSC 10586) TaxID=413071 RepID=G9MV25_HYPVG|nr:uncharacterized protein TRIVIDRAFT_222800 [Trichoderma virens Gv29-8]EHK21680.1 hypothetical protein TRIVIDRAFT_222800 [Trichoderma virens Gv29-8]UKZ57092.1 putative NRPS-like protein biosynthetic cluster [Trichoderma virens]